MGMNVIRVSSRVIFMLAIAFPSQVLRISLLSGVPQAAEQVYGNNGSEIAAASVAALAGKELLIGSSLDGKLLSCIQK